MFVTIGIDPHKSSVTAAVLDEHRQLLAQQRFPATDAGQTSLRRWAARFGERQWAVEGASGLGRPVAQRLVAAGEHVVDVPAKLAARVRLLSTGHNRKTDIDDATAVALVAIDGPALTRVGAEDHATTLRLLTERRDDLVAQRTRTLNRLHALLRDLLPGGAPRHLTAQHARDLLRGLRAPAGPARTRRQLAVAYLRDVEALDRAITVASRELSDAVAAAGTTLTEMFGVGAVVAAKVLGHVGDVRRFPTKAHFASYCGVAPIEASSGDVVRHRLSRAGNRQLNYALHVIALSQIRSNTPGRAYYRSKIAAGKSPAEATRCLKRRLADTVYRRLLDDLPSRQLTAA